MLDSIRLNVTTDGDGDGTATAERPAFGLLYAVQWIDGDLADSNTAVLSVTNTDSAVDQTLHTQDAGEGDDDTWYYPRSGLHDLSAAALTYDGTRAVAGKVAINGALKLVVAAGGDTKTGGCIVYYMR
jgi:hypothetical protein